MAYNLKIFGKLKFSFTDKVISYVSIKNHKGVESKILEVLRE